MNPLKGACIIGQSGGPTAVINASALGAIQSALQSEQVTRVLGAANGIEGVLKERLFDMAREDPGELELLKYTPASALGSCRYKMAAPSVDDTDYRRLLEIFRKYDVRYFFYNGGNDSMDTCNKISKFMQQSGYECRVIGIPKTIDNDLHGTDHCPGFGSAARIYRYLLHGSSPGPLRVRQGTRHHCGNHGSPRRLAGRIRSLRNVCGSRSGLGLPAGSSLPHGGIWQDVDRIYRQNGSCMVAVSEGVQYADGRFVAESGDRDVFGHTQLGGLGAMLAESVKRQTGAKVRSIELSLLQRCASHVASKTDIDEAYMAGKAAVEAAVSGQTDKMVAFERITENGIYSCKTKLIGLEEVANVEKLVPREWINARGNGVEQPFIDYALPLIQGETAMQKECSLPRFAKLRKVPAKPEQR